MPFFKDTAGDPHFLSDEDITNGGERLLPLDCVEITDAEAEVILNPPLTLAQQAALMESAVQQYLDAQAQAKGYDDIVSACSYAATANAFQAESISFLNWRAAVWQYCYNLEAQVQAGTAPAPTEAQLLAELPQRVLP